MIIIIIIIIIITNKLVSGAFRSVRNTLDNVMKERTAERVGEAREGPHLGRT